RCALLRVALRTGTGRPAVQAALFRSEALPATGAARLDLHDLQGARAIDEAARTPEPGGAAEQLTEGSGGCFSYVAPHPHAASDRRRHILPEYQGRFATRLCDLGTAQHR